MLIKKRFPAEVKALTDAAGQPTGEVEFYASVFGNVDLIGDRVMPGAFAKSLQKWARAKAPIPVVFSHTWDDPFAIIGAADATKCVEDATGLKISAMLDIDSNPTARQVYNLMKNGIVREASFAFEVPPGGEKKASDGANNLNTLDLLEVGPCLKGMNPDTADTPTLVKHRAKEALRGSAEETQNALQVAAGQLLGADDNTWVYPRGTFPDHVVVSVSGPGKEEKYFSIDYTLSVDGDVTLGQPIEVDMETEVVPAGTKDQDADDVETKDADDVETKVAEVKDTDAVSEEDAGEAVEPDRTEETPKGQVVWVNGARYVPEVEAKAGRRNSNADQDRVQSMHDTAVALGAACGPDEKVPGVEVADAGEAGHMDTKADVVETKAVETEPETDASEDDVDPDEKSTKAAEDDTVEEPARAKAQDRDVKLEVDLLDLEQFLL